MLTGAQSAVRFGLSRLFALRLAMAFPVRLTAGRYPLEVLMEVRVLHREPYFLA